MFRALAIACFIGAAICVASFFGACDGLVAGDTGGHGSLWSVGFAVILAVAGGWFWRQRGTGAT